MCAMQTGVVSDACLLFWQAEPPGDNLIQHNSKKVVRFAVEFGYKVC